MAGQKTPQANGTGSPLTPLTRPLPTGLEGCAEDRLLAEIERLRNENTELRSKPAGNATGNGAASPSADAELSPERQRLFMGPPTSKDVDAVRRRIRTAVLRSVKKAAHNSKTKPWTEVVEAVTPDMADALCADLPLSSDGKQIKRWDLDDLCDYENRIASWLAAPSIVENVKFLPGNGRDQIITFGVPLSQIKTRACFVTIEVKYKKVSSALHVRVRTAKVEGLRSCHAKNTKAVPSCRDP